MQLLKQKDQVRYHLLRARDDKIKAQQIATIKSLRSQIESLESDDKKRWTGLMRMTNDLKVRYNALHEYTQTNLEYVKERYEHMEQFIRFTRRELHELNETITRNISQIRHQNKNLNETIQQMRKAISALQITQKNLISDISILKINEQENREKITHLQHKVEIVNDQLRSLKEQVSVNKVNIESNTNKIKIAETERIAVTAQVSTKTQDIQESRKQIAANKELEKHAVQIDTLHRDLIQETEARKGGDAQVLQEANQYTDTDRKTDEVVDQLNDKSPDWLSQVGNTFKDLFGGLINGPMELFQSLFKIVPTILQVLLIGAAIIGEIYIAWQVLSCFLPMIMRQCNASGKFLSTTLKNTVESKDGKKRFATWKSRHDERIDRMLLDYEQGLLTNPPPPPKQPSAPSTSLMDTSFTNDAFENAILTMKPTIDNPFDTPTIKTNKRATTSGKSVRFAPPESTKQFYKIDKQKK